MRAREIMTRQMEILAARSEQAPGEELPELTEAMVTAARYLDEKNLQEAFTPMDNLVALRMLVKRAPTVWNVIEEELCPFRFGLPAVNRREGGHCPESIEACKTCWREAMK